MKTKKITKRLLAAFLALFIFGQVFAVSASAAEPRVTITPSANGSQYWKNGSTKEYVYSTIRDCQNGTNSIGYLFPYEEATVYGYYAGYFIVLYTVGTNLKCGFVKYNGGNNNPYWNPEPFKNGANRRPVYANYFDAESLNANSIGSLDPYEECTRLTVITSGLGWCYDVVLYTAGNTPKVGIVDGQRRY